MNNRFEAHLGIPYNFHSGPETEQERTSTNCQKLVKWVLDETHGIYLPPEYKSKEIYEDDRVFKPVPFAAITELDIFIFGRRGENDPKSYHLALVAQPDEDPLLLHATSVGKQGTTVWTLSRFFSVDRYREVRAIKRFDLEEFRHPLFFPPELSKS